MPAPTDEDTSTVVTALDWVIIAAALTCVALLGLYLYRERRKPQPPPQS